MLRRAALWLVPVFVLAPVVSACDPAETQAPAACALPSGDAAPKALSRIVDLQDVLVVTKYEPDPSVLSLSGIVTLSIDEAVERVRQGLLAHGWEILQLDNEGFEAEFYAVARQGVAGVRLRSSACPGQTELTVSVDWD